MRILSRIPGVAVCAAAFAVVSTLATNSVLANTTVAFDNADLSNYATQPNNGWAGINGGFGYNTWTALGGAGGGGTYMEGAGVNNRQVDGSYSFALFAGDTGSYAISRPLTSSIPIGEFDITTRFDLAGGGDNLINLRTGNNTAGFGSGELLSFGLYPNSNGLSYTDSSGLHLLTADESRGAIWQWTIDFNAITGAYSGSAVSSTVNGGTPFTFSGTLEAAGTSVGSFAVINQSSGGNQNLIFDSPTFIVPEPASLSLLAIGALGLLAQRRKCR